jgi:hypothetical protein
MPGIYEKMIMDATKCSAFDAKYVENIMRDDIFHSTLDWQSPAQFKKGARDAVKLLKLCRSEPSCRSAFQVRS